MIHVASRSLSALLDDLDLAAEAIRVDEMVNYEDVYRQEQEQERIEELRELKSDERGQRERLGDELYGAYFKMVRWSSQRALLGLERRIPVLDWMYGRPKRSDGDHAGQGLLAGVEEVARAGGFGVIQFVLEARGGCAERQTDGRAILLCGSGEAGSSGSSVAADPRIRRWSADDAVG